MFIYRDIIIAIATLAFLYYLSYARSLRPIGSTILNPVLFIILIHIITVLDYAFLYSGTQSQLASHLLDFDQDDIEYAFFEYNILFLLLSIGIGMGLSIKPVKLSGSIYLGNYNINKPVVSFKVAAFIVLAAILLSAQAVYQSFISSGGRIVLHAVHSESIGDTGKFVSHVLLITAVCIVFWYLRSKKLVLLFLSTILLVVFLVSGSRTRIIAILIPIASVLDLGGLKIKRSYYLVIALIFAIFAVWYVLLRIEEVGNHNDIIISGNVLKDIFMLNDLSFAEVGTILHNDGESYWSDRFTGSSFVGGFMAPIPRSILAFKPVTGSLFFTQQFDPYGLDMFHRGLVIGAINEVKVEFGLVLGSIILLAIGFLWSRAIIYSLRDNGVFCFSLFVNLYYWAFLFFRNDIMTVGQGIWGFIIVWVLARTVARVTWFQFVRNRKRGL